MFITNSKMNSYACPMYYAWGYLTCVHFEVCKL